MCRLYGFHANEPTKVECTLVHAQNAILHQSRSDLRGTPHTDGWGISWYPNGKPQRERRPAAAHEDIWFSTVAERTYSRTVLAHVRRATIGNASSKNTHPFVHGCWAFAHNGTIENFEQIKAKLETQTSEQLRSACLGTTDSETLFYWILTRLQQAGIPLDAPSNQKSKLVKLIATALHDLRTLGERKSLADKNQLNLLFTNGRTLLATRWNHSLYYVHRLGVHDCEICGVPHIQQESTRDYRACVVASEPISSEKWIKVPDHSILVVSDEIIPSLHPIS